MRYKHVCQGCGKPFTRRWNMERHMIREHDTRQCFFSNSAIAHQMKYKTQRSDYYNSFLDHQNLSSGFDWSTFGAFSSEQNNPSWLERLRKLAEFSRMLKEILPTPALQSSVDAFHRSIEQSNMHLPPFKIEDLEIIGYTAYICNDCLISHPLILYWHSASKKLVPTIHTCNDERKIEVHQGIRNKNEVITNLSDELPDLMCRVVKQWTKGRPVLKATLAPYVSEDLYELNVIDRKKWGIRAIRERFTALSDEELADFLNLAGENTYAYVRTEDQNKTYFMCIKAA